jgi:hypothetical protein
VLATQVATFLDRHPEVRLELIMRDHVGDQAWNAERSRTFVLL